MQLRWICCDEWVRIHSQISLLAFNKPVSCQRLPRYMWLFKTLHLLERKREHWIPRHGNQHSSLPGRIWPLKISMRCVPTRRRESSDWQHPKPAKKCWFSNYYWLYAPLCTSWILLHMYTVFVFCFLYENISVMMDGSSLQPCVKHEIKKKNTESKRWSLISFNMIDPKINIPQPIYQKPIYPPHKAWRREVFWVNVGSVASLSPQSEQFVSDYSDYSPWCDFIWF